MGSKLLWSSQHFLGPLERDLPADIAKGQIKGWTVTASQNAKDRFWEEDQREGCGRQLSGPKGWKGCAWYELCGVWEALAAWGELLEKKQTPRARLGRRGHQTARTDDAVTDSSHITAVRGMEAETGEAGGDPTQVSKEHSFIFCYQLADTCFTLSQLSSNFPYNASFTPSPLPEKNVY